MRNLFNALFLFWILGGILSSAFLSAASCQDDPSPKSTQPAARSEDHEKALAFLEELYDLYNIPAREGLESIEATMRIRSAKDQALSKMADTYTIEYRWEADEPEQIQVRGGSGALRKVVKDSLKGIGVDLAWGGLHFPVKELDLILEEDGMNKTIYLSTQGKAAGKVVVDGETHIVTRVELKGRGKGATYVPTFALRNKRFRLEERLLVVADKEGTDRPRNAYAYSHFREINHFHLPTQLSVGLNRNQMVFEVEYTLINGEKALLMEADPALVKTLIKEFDKNYTQWGASEKREAFQKLVETGSDKAAEAIAKRGLKDKDLQIRQEAVQCLAAMKSRKVVSTLTKSLKRNTKHPEVYMEIIHCLGEIGDPKAIPVLSSDMWGGDDDIRASDAGKAKIEALGKIRSKKSVEALIDLMYIAKPWTLGSIRSTLRDSLKKLTGQDFQASRKKFQDERNLWKDWWNKNKNSFKLEEDRR